MLVTPGTSSTMLPAQGWQASSETDTSLSLLCMIGGTHCTYCLCTFGLYCCKPHRLSINVGPAAMSFEAAPASAVLLQHTATYAGTSKRTFQRLDINPANLALRGVSTVVVQLYRLLKDLVAFGGTCWLSHSQTCQMCTAGSAHPAAYRTRMCHNQLHLKFALAVYHS